MNRRRFLARGARLAGGLALGGPLLAGCRRGEREAIAGEAAADASHAVRISNWPLYIDSATTRLFENATGIHASYTEDVNDTHAYFAKVAPALARGQSIERDVVVLTDWMVGRMIRLGWCRPLDNAAFPDKARLLPELRHPSFDPGRRYTVPWMSGMTGLAYNRRRTGRDLTGMRDLFDPRFRGRVTMLTEMRDTLGLVMLANGRAPERATMADVDAACALVQRYRENGQIRAFTGNDYTEDLASGNIAVAVAYSGDAAGLAQDNPDLGFVVPEEGGMWFSDCMFIPAPSHRVRVAMAWMNYVYQPAVAARIVEATLYISPVAGTGRELARTAPALARNPLVNPGPALRARLHDFRALSDEEDRSYNRLFYRAMGV